MLGEGQAVPMHRFRPNVVVTGTQAWEEDDWDTFTVSAPSHAPCKFRSVMPCDRCKVGANRSVPEGFFLGGWAMAISLWQDPVRCTMLT